MSEFDDLDDNPFKDSSIHQATKPIHNVDEDIKNYTPFDHPSSGQPAVLQPTGQPAVLQLSQEPPAYSKKSTVVPENEREREERLRLREEEVARRERELERINVNNPETNQHNPRRNNWPPIVESFGITPCFYMDLEVEIKPEFQHILKRLYQLWTLHGFMLVLNVFGAMLLLINNGEIISFAVSIIYLVLFAPLSFLCWYRPVYKAFREDSSVQFMVFFFVFTFQFLITTFMAVGILSTGSCGIWKAIQCLRSATVMGKVIGVIILFIALGFSATAGIELFLLSRMLQIYRGSSASMEKARNEFAQGVLGNQIVRDAATDAAAASIRVQLDQHRR